MKDASECPPHSNFQGMSPRFHILPSLYFVAPYNIQYTQKIRCIIRCLLSSRYWACGARVVPGVRVVVRVSHDFAIIAVLCALYAVTPALLISLTRRCPRVIS